VDTITPEKVDKISWIFFIDMLTSRN